MMGTYHSIKAYQERLEKLKQDLKKKEDAVRDAANFMRNIAIKLAPKKTGALISGIRARKKGKGRYIVESIVHKNFPYNLWVNREERLKRIRLVWAKDRKKHLYGGKVITKSGNVAVWTGTPKFWDISVKRTRRKFKKLVIRDMRKAIKG